MNKNALNQTATIPANFAVYIIGTRRVVNVVLTKWEPALINFIPNEIYPHTQKINKKNSPPKTHKKIARFLKLVPSSPALVTVLYLWKNKPPPTNKPINVPKIISHIIHPAKNLIMKK